MKRYFLILSVVLLPLLSFSQVKSYIDSADILIGEQPTLIYELTQKSGDNVFYPKFGRNITPEVECIENLKPDTTELGGGKLKVEYKYIITAFDSGTYVIPQQIFMQGADTLSSDSVVLNVNTVKIENIDTADVKDIKDIMDPPFSWTELITWLALILCLLLLIAAVVIFILKYGLKKKVPGLSFREKPKLPPHVIALQKLEEIKRNKSWQDADIKIFYTQVTDVIREYIDGQFGINAMELTTDEIVEMAKHNPELSQVISTLKEVLALADLVKFAKYVPLENDNNRSLLHAFTVVETTMPQPEASQTDKEDKV